MLHTAVLRGSACHGLPLFTCRGCSCACVAGWLPVTFLRFTARAVHFALVDYVYGWIRYGLRAYGYYGLVCYIRGYLRLPRLRLPHGLLHGSYAPFTPTRVADTHTHAITHTATHTAVYIFCAGYRSHRTADAGYAHTARTFTLRFIARFTGSARTFCPSCCCLRIRYAYTVTHARTPALRIRVYAHLPHRTRFTHARLRHTLRFVHPFAPCGLRLGYVLRFCVHYVRLVRGSRLPVHIYYNARTRTVTHARVPRGLVALHGCAVVYRTRLPYWLRHTRLVACTTRHHPSFTCVHRTGCHTHTLTTPTGYRSAYLPTRFYGSVTAPLRFVQVTRLLVTHALRFWMPRHAAVCLGCRCAFYTLHVPLPHARTFTHTRDCIPARFCYAYRSRGLCHTPCTVTHRCGSVRSTRPLFTYLWLATTVPLPARCLPTPHRILVTQFYPFVTGCTLLRCSWITFCGLRFCHLRLPLLPHICHITVLYLAGLPFIQFAVLHPVLVLIPLFLDTVLHSSGYTHYLYARLRTVPFTATWLPFTHTFAAHTRLRLVGYAVRFTLVWRLYRRCCRFLHAALVILVLHAHGCARARSHTFTRAVLCGLPHRTRCRAARTVYTAYTACLPVLFCGYTLPHVAAATCVHTYLCRFPLPGWFVYLVCRLFGSLRPATALPVHVHTFVLYTLPFWLLPAYTVVTAGSLPAPAGSATG